VESNGSSRQTGPRRSRRASASRDPDAWARACGRTLWKALITASGIDDNQREHAQSWRTIARLVAERRQLAGHAS
jgi:hypothetical protein